MRNRPRLCAAAFLLGAIGSPMRGGAQDLPELERRVDAAVSAWKQSVTVLEDYRHRAGPTRVFADTVAILDGAVRLVTDSEFLPIVRDAGALVDPFIRARAVAATAGLRGTVFAVWSDSIRRAEHGLVVSPRVNDREVDVRYAIANAGSLAQILETHLQSRVGTPHTSAFTAWLAGTLPLTPAPNTEWRALRLELVSSHSSVTHRCFAGDLAACKVTLGFITEADPATAWYDSTTRRALVKAASNIGNLERHLSASCLGGSDSACVELLRTSRAMEQWLAPPGTSLSRMALVQQAFSMGPSGALARLAVRNDLPTEAIGAIAGAPVDSVISQWQRHVRDGGVESEVATSVVALGALGWILAMGALSLRSPRWR